MVLDLSAAHVWDASAVGAIDRAVLRFRKRGVAVEVVGLNPPSASLVERVGTYDDPSAVVVAGH